MSSAATCIAREPDKTPPGKAKLQLLLVEDNAADADLMLHALQEHGFEVATTVVQTASEFHKRIREEFPDIVLADYNLGAWRGTEALEILHREGLDIPVIMVTGGLGAVTAVECIKQGATDFVLKDSLARLPESVRRALREKRLREKRRQAEEYVAKKIQELARSNAELEQFAYVASHDLQEPLRMVAAYTQLLSDRYSGKLDEQADKYIRYAVEGATRMQTLVQDLLEFSRAGSLKNGVSPTDCNAAVEQALVNLHAAVAESGATVKRSPLPVVTANFSQLVQIFQNIIGNALKFHGPDAPLIRIGAEKKAAEWVFSITDNGIGMAPDDRRSIFDVFKRLHTRTEYPGNGIGLSICKKIIELHGGKIWVASQPDRGSTFKFTLPVNEQKPVKRKRTNDEENS
jgi:signal transduction histidine kinase